MSIIPLLVSLCGLAGRAIAAPLGNCDCYKSAAGDIFTSHITLDFRQGKPAAYDSFFSPLDVDGYNGGETKNKMTPSLISFGNGYLELKTQNTGGTQQSADIESSSPVLYGTFRSRFSVTGSAGGVAGFFTFKDTGKDECDIEILTSDSKNKIHYTNHVNGNDESNPHAVPTISADWSQFNSHRFDWTADASTFYVNGKQTAKLTEGMPTQASSLVLNMWSAGSIWGGVMAPGGTASMKVQWVQAFYNTTDSASKSCTSFCDVK